MSVLITLSYDERIAGIRDASGVEVCQISCQLFETRQATRELGLPLTHGSTFHDGRATKF